MYRQISGIDAAENKNRIQQHQEGTTALKLLEGALWKLALMLPVLWQFVGR
jgi:hypothetical protein